MKKRKFNFGDTGEIEEAKKDLHSDDYEQIERSKKPYTKDERDAKFRRDFADDANALSNKDAEIDLAVEEYFEKEPELRKMYLRDYYFCSIRADYTHYLPDDVERDCTQARRNHRGFKSEDYKKVIEQIKKRDRNAQRFIDKLNKELEQYDKK